LKVGAFRIIRGYYTWVKASRSNAAESMALRARVCPNVECGVRNVRLAYGAGIRKKVFSFAFYVLSSELIGSTTSKVEFDIIEYKYDK